MTRPTKKTAKARPTTKTLQEVAEDLILRATSNPSFQPCNSTADMLVRALEGGFRHTRKPVTQVEKLLHHLKTVGSISQREAYLEYDIQSFHRRLTDIKDLGYSLKGSPKTNPVTGQEYTRYTLVS